MRRRLHGVGVRCQDWKRSEERFSTTCILQQPKPAYAYQSCRRACPTCMSWMHHVLCALCTTMEATSHEALEYEAQVNTKHRA